MKNYIFGYGSLISKENRKRTGITGSSFLVRIKGYKRSWNVLISKEKTIALGLEKNNKSTCNGVIFEVPYEEISLFDKREGNSYQRMQIFLDKIIFLGEKIKEGNIWVYLTKIKGKPSKEFPIYQSYVDVILTGCLEISEEFAQEFIKNTYNWKFIENDRENPKYPRSLKKLEKQKEIDILMELRK